MAERNGSVCSESVLSLFQTLSYTILEQALARDQPSAHDLVWSLRRPTKQPVWSTEDRLKSARELTRRAFDAVLLRKWQWHGVLERDGMAEESRCLAYMYYMDVSGRHDEARRLEAAVTSLSEGGLLLENSAVLAFLSLLAPEPTCLSTQPHQFACLEDTSFPVYPDSLFECLPGLVPLSSVESALSESMALFACPPGSGFRGFMSASPLGENRAPLPSDLFGGLLHSTVCDVNTTLDLPNIPSEQSAISLLKTNDSGVGSLEEDSSLGADASPYNKAITQGPTLSELLSYDGSILKRNWEGWLHPKPYLTDNQDTFTKSCDIALARTAELVGVALPLAPDDSLPRSLLRRLDTLPCDVLGELARGGCTDRAFARALDSLTAYCRAQLHSLADGSSDLSLQASSNQLLPLVRFLLETSLDLTHCPKGLALLDALFQQACAIQGTPHYPFLLSLLRQTSAPYLQFVKQWVFQGRSDQGEEFGLHANVEALTKRDRRYWLDGYTTPLPQQCCAPLFLSSHGHTVLTCGKALNLLRLCCPSHPLCSDVSRQPTLSLALSQSQLDDISAGCQSYRALVLAEEAHGHEEEKERLQGLQEAARAAVVRARREARENAELVRRLEEELVREAGQRKASLHLELRQQVDQARALRAAVEQEERAKDRELMAALTRREDALTAEELRLEEEAKAEVVAHYHALSREAERRKARAEWRLKRLGHTPQRQALLLQEEAAWQHELEEMRSKPPLAKQLLLSEQKRPRRKTWKESLAQQSLVEESLAEESLGEEGLGFVPPVLPTVSLQANEVSPEDNPVVSRAYEEDGEKAIGMESDLAVGAESHLHSIPLLPADESIHDTSPSLNEPSSTPQEPVHHHKLPSDSSSGSHELPDHHLPPLHHHYTRGPGERPSQIQTLLYPGSPSPNDGLALHQDAGVPLLKTTRGQAPSSSVQRLMYPLPTASGGGGEAVVGLLRTSDGSMVATRDSDLADGSDDGGKTSALQPFQDDFSILDQPPGGASLIERVLGPLNLDSGGCDAAFLSLYPLPSLLEHSVILPIITQSQLVNEALLRHFTHDCDIMRHFLALKKFLLIEDGEFGHALSTRLCEQLTFGGNWRELTSPAFLNPLLSAALAVSLHGQTKEAGQLGFTLAHRPRRINTHAVDALDFLELRYKVDWPCNLVITDDSIKKYNSVLHLMLQLKRASWALRNTFTHLRQGSMETRQHGTVVMETRRLQTHRHELQHFVNIMHSYISNQVFLISWEEFQAELRSKVHSLDDLIAAHNSFINKAIFRCLLSKKAKPVMRIIRDVLAAVLTFSAQASSAPHHPHHPHTPHMYRAMCDTHQHFREAAGLLIRVVNKLIKRGYQPHLEDFLLRLNFNSFYIP